MGYAKHFFTNKHVDCCIKYQVYTSDPLNILLWDCKTWNLDSSQGEACQE
jgi:hypothetical protein